MYDISNRIVNFQSKCQCWPGGYVERGWKRNGFL
jgi:hypothetical protein